MKIRFEKDSPIFCTENNFDVFLFEIIKLNSDYIKLKLVTDLQSKLEAKDDIENLFSKMRIKYSKKFNIET